MPAKDLSSGNESGEVQAVQIIQYRDVKFGHPRESLYNASQPISGCAWVETDDGVVLFDTLQSKKAAKKTLDKIHEVSGKIKYIIYSHGHLDHIRGAPVFMVDEPEVIANALLPERLDSYKMLARYRARVSAMQFNIPEIVIEEDYVYPTKTFQGSMTFTLGDKTFELYTARAETDDVCWTYVPEIKAAFIGDMVIGSFPNIGNPWKPSRFTLGWVKCLEEVRAREPEIILCNGGSVVYQEDEVQAVLDANIEAIRSLHDQVVEHINNDMHITEMIHAVDLPHHLKESPYLQFSYSRPEFFVFNVYRWYHGYFDHNPANLLPRPEKEVMAEIYDLIGGPEKILSRAEQLYKQNQAQLALQVLDILIQADPENLYARELRIKLLERLGADDYCLMSRNTWVYYIKKDKDFLRSKRRL